MSDFIQLPISGDLWRAPEVDENGAYKTRSDTVSLDNLTVPSKISPDVAALLMAELEANKPKKKSHGTTY